jgi:hypothetical protein
VLLSRARFSLLGSPIFLNSGFGGCDCGSSEAAFLLSRARGSLPERGSLRLPAGVLLGAWCTDFRLQLLEFLHLTLGVRGFALFTI